MHDPTGGRDRARLAATVTIVGLAWGIMYALYPIGLERSGPIWLAAMRFDVFVVGAGALCLLRGRFPTVPATARDWTAVLAYAMFNVVLHNLGLMAGTQHVPVAVVAILTGLNPMLTLMIARAFLPRVHISAASVTGLVLAFAGAGVLALRGGVGGAAVSWTWALVVFGGVLAWSVGSVALKAAASPMPPLSLAFWAALVGAVALQLGAFALEPVPHVDGALLGTVAFAGLVGGLASFLIWNNVVREFGPQRANLSSYLSPVAASVAAWMLIGQRLEAAHAVAYVLVAVGLTLAVYSGKPSIPIVAPE